MMKILSKDLNFHGKKILRRNDNINASYLSSISLKIVFFWWMDGKTATWNVATWWNQELQFFWTPLIVTQNHWQYKTRDYIVFNGKTLSQIAKVEYFRLRLPYIKTTLNFVAISSGFWWGVFWVKKKITKRFINKTSYNITLRYVYLHPLKDRNSSSLIFVKYVVFTDSLTYPLIKFVCHIETEISGIWHFFLLHWSDSMQENPSKQQLFPNQYGSIPVPMFVIEYI